MIAVEKLLVHELHQLERIGTSFTTEVKYPGGFEISPFKQTWTALLNAGLGEIFIVRDPKGEIMGCLGATFAGDMFNGRLTACESFWYVLKEHRSGRLALYLFDAFEAEAGRRECEKLVFVHLVGEHAEMLEKLYTRRGYSLVEKNFWKLR